jgi:spore coat polysaccharide biosynthesis protein SpsF
MPRTVAIIQARMSSSRLPGKVLLDLGGKPMLAWVVERAKMANSIDMVGVATTDDSSDDALVDFCVIAGVSIYRGSMHDVLDRYYQAARLFEAQVVVRITGDCPLIDPALVDYTVAEFFRSGADFAANRLPPPWKRTYPIGLDTEVASFAALERAWKEAKQLFEREHVMPYLYDEAGRFNIKLVNHDVDYGALRWTVDTAEDLELMRKLIAHFEGRNDFTWLEVLEYYNQHPELQAINAEIRHKSMTDVDQGRGDQK